MFASYHIPAFEMFQTIVLWTVTVKKLTTQTNITSNKRETITTCDSPRERMDQNVCGAAAQGDKPLPPLYAGLLFALLYRPRSH